MFSRTFMIFNLVAYYDTIHLSHSSVGLYVSLFSHSVFFFLVTVFDLSFLFFYQIAFSVKETNIDQQYTCCFILLKFNSSDVQFINTVINTCRTNILKKCDLKIWQKRLFRKNSQQSKTKSKCNVIMFTEFSIKL